MKRFLSICVALVAWSLMSAQAQTATDVYEGVRVTVDASTGTQVLTWWGRAGRTYFVQQSYDLINWTYVPVVHGGAAAVDGLNFASTDARQFWRLKYTDASTGGLSAADADFDSDGVSNIDELNSLIDPFNSDTDGDHYGDGIERDHNSDPATSGSIPALSTSGPEKSQDEWPVSLLGYYKTVNNDWSRSKPAGQPETASGYVSWGDDSPQTGSTPYPSYAPAWADKYSLLTYPSTSTTFRNLGYLAQASALGRSVPGTVPGIDETFSHADLLHYQVQIGSTNGQPQPWPIYRKLLSYKSTQPWNGGARTYSELHYERFFIRQGKSVSEKDIPLEPAVEIGKHNEEVLEFLDIYMRDWAKAQSYDNISHTEVGTKTPWIMLPVGEAREIGVWHNVGDVTTLYLRAEGTGLSPASLFEVDASTPYAVTGQTIGDTSFLRIGVGNPGDTSPLMTPDSQPDLVADYQNLLRFTVKAKKQLLVVIHPICLATLDENGNSQPGALPQYLPEKQDIEDYLNSIFEVQANVHVTVQMLAVVQTPWDVGMGATVPAQTNLGAGNGILDCYFNATFLGKKVSDEENSIFLSSPPDPQAGINLYYVVAPNGGRYRGWFSPSNELAGEMDNLGSAGFLGWAGPATNEHFSNAVFVLDYPSNETGDPGVLWTMAHELGHGVGKLKHTCGAALEWTHPNSMFGSDNENRLMTGRSGPKRALAPAQMIKYEWDQINDSTNVQR
jgi:hypothetical protein